LEESQQYYEIILRVTMVWKVFQEFWNFLSAKTFYFCFRGDYTQRFFAKLLQNVFLLFNAYPLLKKL